MDTKETGSVISVAKRVFKMTKNNFYTSVAKTIYFWLTIFGFDPRKFLFAVRTFPGFIYDYWLIRSQNRTNQHFWSIKPNFPCLYDRFASSGSTQGHYFYQDLYVAQRIFQAQPAKHVDVASRIDGFVAHMATFRTVEVLDIRALDIQIRNIVFRQCDFLELPKQYVEYSDSVSCLHALEHFGLGRYGDQIDLHGYLKGFENLHRLLVKDGILYLSVPIGYQRIEFNGHRVFSLRTILEMCAGRFELINFSYIDDQGGFWPNFSLSKDAISCDLDLNFGCGIFELRKL